MEVVVRGDRRLVTAGLKDVVAAVRDDAAARDGAGGGTVRTGASVCAHGVHSHGQLLHGTVPDSVLNSDC